MKLLKVCTALLVALTLSCVKTREPTAAIEVTYPLAERDALVARIAAFAVERDFHFEHHRAAPRAPHNNDIALNGHGMTIWAAYFDSSTCMTIYFDKSIAPPQATRTSVLSEVTRMSEFIRYTSGIAVSPVARARC